ncbi:MAG: PqqD family protein [Frisingicoccus sp.]|uniref:PqqD family protein n=1 Tax=Frisingicoccus sp. TaxID=1918627 RepID=UPI002A81D71F|nr:PqqD family protein [Frisingicoccus sp.]MDY4834311.1 PqqD family protein [Frisingicoccus sp.]
MRLIEDHILRKVNGNVVLVPLSDRETDFKGMIVLNHTGEFICRMLEKDTDQNRLVESLAQEYGMKPEQVEADVDAFLSELVACHVLIR